MAIDRVFPNPTVKQVIFQIKFPNLFYIESKIGDFQINIMEEFPQSRLLQRREVVFAEIGEEVKFDEIPSELRDKSLKKIWQFESPKNYRLSVLSNSLDITSEFHKTYSNPASPDRFRDIIDFILKHFFELTRVPIIERIGLRYVDECPIQSKDNETFSLWYNSAFPLNRFDMAKATEMDFKTVIERNGRFLRYMESLQATNEGPKLILDFDGWAVNVKPADCLAIADELHLLISEEYERTIKDPVYDYMSQER